MPAEVVPPSVVNVGAEKSSLTMYVRLSFVLEATCSDAHRGAGGLRCAKMAAARSSAAPFLTAFATTCALVHDIDSMALTVEATVALAVARPSARTNSLKPRDAHTESTTALVANCPCPVVNCPRRTQCALSYSALSLVCLAVTSAGRLPKSAPPDPSTVPQPILLR